MIIRNKYNTEANSIPPHNVSIIINSYVHLVNNALLVPSNIPYVNNPSKNESNKLPFLSITK